MKTGKRESNELVKCIDCIHARVRPDTGGNLWHCVGRRDRLIGGRRWRNPTRNHTHSSLTRPRRCQAFRSVEEG
jgi:hypothetical protein